jgi:hypothetical protein
MKKLQGLVAQTTIDGKIRQNNSFPENGQLPDDSCMENFLQIIFGAEPYAR